MVCVKRPRVSVLMTAFYYRSHAHCFLENLLQPYLFNGEWIESSLEAASFYVEQFPPNDMARAVAADFNIPIYPSIAEALCLGGDQLAVDGVLLIAEHGAYPMNAFMQREYPRKQFFDECVAVYRQSGEVAPIFIDKHLSHRFEWARAIYDTAHDMGIPLMAGSSVPLAERRPPFELPEDAEICEAAAVHGGPIEAYDFHALELLASLTETRRGGETGVSEVRFLEGENLWEVLGESATAKAAIEIEFGWTGSSIRSLAESVSKGEGIDANAAHGIQAIHRDGLRSIVFKLGGGAVRHQIEPTRYARWNVACRLTGEGRPRATTFYTGPWQNRNLFKALVHAIEAFICTRRAPYPVERTLLVSGVLDVAMHSRVEGRAMATPELDIAYRPGNWQHFREMGASWKIITEDTPEPAELKV
jgi:hypothetical protein